MHYAPLCDACRTHSTTTYFSGCAGCQARRIAAERSAALTKAQVAGMDSTFQPLEKT